MPTAVPIASVERQTTALDDYRTWEDIKRIARLIAEQAANELSTLGPGQSALWATQLEIGGADYYIRSEVYEKSSDPPIILVAIERHQRDQPTERELRRRYGLTPCETRAALLLPERRSNREIAEELRVTEHTARRHTEKVLLKLGIHRRGDVQQSLIGCRNPVGKEELTIDDRRRCSRS